MSATTLYGNEWYGDVNPTTGVLPGQSWVQPTNGTVWRRNTSNTAWTPFGSINSSLGGALNGGGDTATGPLLDLPNLAPINNPAFTGTMLLNGIAVALQTDLSAQQKSLYDDIVNGVSQQFLSLYQQSGTASDIAYLCATADIPTAGFSGSGPTLLFTVPLATFMSDNIQATPSQELGYGWAIQTVGATQTSSTVSSWNVIETVTGSRQLYLSSPGTFYPSIIHLRYWSLAVR